MNRPVAPNVLRSQQKHLQPAGQRALRWRIQARRPHPRTSGLISSSLGLALLVLAGSAAIVAGALSLVSASSRGSDAEQAREAAEEGYNRVIDLLNDPGNSYLLVTKRDNWTSNTVTAQERQTCNISSSTTGAISAASIIETPTPFPSVGNGRQVRYTLESFTPPQYPGAAPSGCTKFGNLAGGTARLVIRGDVLRNGSVIASHRIERAVTVEALPGGGSSGGSTNPYAFIGLGGGASSLIAVEKDPSIMSRIAQDSGTTPWRWDTSDTSLIITCLGMTEPQCRTGSSSLSSAFPVEELTISKFLSMFGPKPPTPTGTPAITASAWTSAAITNASASGSTINYPYSSGTTLRPNCRQVQVLKPTGQPEDVIACKVNNLYLDAKDLSVNTTNYPVILYMIANTSTAKTAQLYLKNAQIINTVFSSSRATNPKSWNRLRIFGDPRSAHQVSASITPSACDGDSSKETWFIEGSGRINGAFIWAQTVTLEMKEPTGNALTEYSLFGANWACKIKYEKYVRHLINSPGDANDGINDLFGISSQVYSYSARGI